MSPDLCECHARNMEDIVRWVTAINYDMKHHEHIYVNQHHARAKSGGMFVVGLSPFHLHDLKAPVASRTSSVPPLTPARLEVATEDPPATHLQHRLPRPATRSESPPTTGHAVGMAVGTAVFDGRSGR